MYSDTEVLHRLGGPRSAQDLASMLSRILRVPEAWKAIHEVSVLDQIVEADIPADLSASQLACVSLGAGLGTGLIEAAEPHRARAKQAWEEADFGVAGLRALTDVALLGSELSRRYPSEHSIIDRILASPAIWHSPIAVAWPAISEPEAFLSQLIEGGAFELALNGVLSNLPLDEAAGLLTNNINGSTVKMVQLIIGRGELALARVLSPENSASIDVLAPVLIGAVRSWSQGNHEQARDSLSQAWDSASESAALVADLTARQAGQIGDRVTEHEANRKALEILPSPKRRARTALSLVRLERPSEAISLLSGSDLSSEEQIALGLAQLAVGQPAANLVGTIGEFEDIDDDWFAPLADGLQSVGERLEVALWRRNRYPASSIARLSLAQSLHEAGDDESADPQVRLAIALDPDSTEAIQLQAEILESSERHPEALKAHDKLAALGVQDTARHLECAIAAGDLERARTLLDELLIEDPNTPLDLIMSAKIRAAEGDREGARTKLEAAIRAAPQVPEAYTALFDLYRDSGEADSARSTLNEAAQANPKDASIQRLRAEELRRAGRLSEALEAASVAHELGGQDARVLLIHAELLSDLGHSEEALGVLHSALQIQPRNWQLALALARTYLVMGDLDQAINSALAPPHNAPFESQFEYARIMLDCGSSGPPVLAALDRAEESGDQDPRLSYWYGLALEREGRFDEALARYQQARLEIPTKSLEDRERAYLGSARAAIGQGEIALAISVLEEAQKELPPAAPILAAASQAYQAARLADPARALAEQAVELDPDDPSAWQALAAAQAGMGDFQNALKAVERVSALDPSAVEGWLALADISISSNETVLARRALAEVIWRGRRRPPILERAARFTAAAGLPGSAARVLKAAIRLSPDDARLLGALAELQQASGDWEAAYANWQACSELLPLESEPLRQTAVCARKLGQLSVTVGLLEKSLSVDPRNPKLRRELAAAYLDHGQIRRGLTTYATAVREAPNDLALASEAIEAALRAGDPRYALGLIGKVRQLVADVGQLKTAMAEAYLLLDEWDKAESALESARDEEFSSARMLAMMAVVKPDQAAAKEALSLARLAPLETVGDAIWLARAELRFFEWANANSALEDWADDPFGRLERDRAVLRMRDAQWLLYEGDASEAAPPADLIARPKYSLNALNVSEDQPGTLGAWLRSQEDPSTAIDRDATGWIGEAAAIGYLRTDQIEQSISAIGQTRQACERPEWASVLEGLARERDGRVEEARAAYRSAPESDAIASYLLGRSYARAGIMERAATHIGAAVMQHPERPQWQHALAGIYDALGDSDSALVHYQEAATARPQQVRYLHSLARAYRDCGQPNQAKEAYGMAIAQGTDDLEIYLEAGQTALDIDDYVTAREWFDRACTIAPSDIQSLVGAAHAAMATGDKLIARERIGTAGKLAPEDPKVLLGHGHISVLSGDYKAALSAFEDALAAGAEARTVRRYQSKVLAQQGKYGPASEAIQDLLAEFPDDHMLWHELALTLESNSDLKAADEAVREAARIAPLNPEYRLSLGRVTRKSGNLDRAIEELRLGADADPNDPRLSIETGLVYEDRREYARALDAYQKAIEMDPECIDAYYRAGLLLRTLKAYRRAGDMLRHAAELAPVDQAVMHQLAAVRALELVHG